MISFVFYISWVLLHNLVWCQNATGSPSDEFHRLESEYWDWWMRENPEFATDIGDYRFLDKSTSYKLSAYEHRKEKVESFLTSLRSIDPKLLSANTRDNYEFLVESLAAYVDGYRWLRYGTLNPINFLEGFQTSITLSLMDFPFRNIQDFNKFLIRLAHKGQQIDEFIELFREAIRLNRTYHIVSIDRVPEQLSIIITQNPTDSKYFMTINEQLHKAQIPPVVRPGIRQRLVSILVNQLGPKLEKLSNFLGNEYMHHTRSGLGIDSWENGAELYKAVLKFYLSTDMLPDEIHELGLQETERIRQNIEEVLVRLGRAGDLHGHLDVLYSDPNQFYPSTEAMLSGYGELIEKRIIPKLTEIFSQAYNLPLGIRASDVDGPAGQYSPGSANGSIEGTFLVNTNHLLTSPKFRMMALALHETLPGHHLQSSAALTSGLPPYRMHFDSHYSGAPFDFPSYAAYTEGWGLYAESLGEELGLYQDDNELLGRYLEEQFRACRLVVDTGLHSKGWSRENAIEFMLSETGQSRDIIEVEVDRYITWPGQACAYKIGEMKIKEVRQNAEDLLGENFDIREFHDVILKTGPVSLSKLEDVVDEWISSKSQNE